MFMLLNPCVTGGFMKTKSHPAPNMLAVFMTDSGSYF